MPGPTLTLAQTTLPSWLVIPIAGIMLILISRHVLRVQATETNTFRRRLRIANGLTMMFTATLIAYALGVAPAIADSSPRSPAAATFIVVWTIIVALLTLTVMMAAADALQTMRTAARLRRELREELAAGIGQARRETAPAAKGGESARG